MVVIEGIRMEANIYTASARKAFIVRVSSTDDKMLAENEVMIGWSKADGLLDEKLTKEDFTGVVQKEYFPKEDTKHRAGQIAGDFWRFIREMSEGNYVLVPTEGGFYIGRVVGPAYYNEMKIFNDTAYRRKVEWLNDKKVISIDMTTEELQRKLKSLQQVLDVSDLYIEIEFALRHA